MSEKKKKSTAWSRFWIGCGCTLLLFAALGGALFLFLMLTG